MPQFWKCNNDPFFTMLKIDFDCNLSKLWLKNEKIASFFDKLIFLQNNYISENFEFSEYQVKLACFRAKPKVYAC